MKNNKINKTPQPGLKAHLDNYFSRNLDIFYNTIKRGFIPIEQKDELIATHVILVHYLKEKLNANPEEFIQYILDNWETRMQEVITLNIEHNSEHYIGEKPKKWEDHIIDMSWLGDMNVSNFV